MRQKSGIKIMLIVGAVAVAAGCLAYIVVILLFKENSVSAPLKSPAPKATPGAAVKTTSEAVSPARKLFPTFAPTAVPTPSSAPAQTGGKTGYAVYVFPRHRFSFRYPSSWIISRFFESQTGDGADRVTLGNILTVDIYSLPDQTLSGFLSGHPLSAQKPVFKKITMANAREAYQVSAGGDIKGIFITAKRVLVVSAASKNQSPGDTIISSSDLDPLMASFQVAD